MRNIIGKTLLIISVICAIFAIILVISNEDTQEILIPSIVKEKLNLEKFNQIEMGMTYKQVVEIIGEEGTILSETEFSDIKTVIYSWYGEGSIGANANVTFQNDKAISKAQYGLD